MAVTKIESTDVMCRKSGMTPLVYCPRFGGVKALYVECQELLLANKNGHYGKHARVIQCLRVGRLSGRSNETRTGALHRFSIDSRFL